MEQHDPRKKDEQINVAVSKQIRSAWRELCESLGVNSKEQWKVAVAGMLLLYDQKDEGKDLISRVGDADFRRRLGELFVLAREGRLSLPIGVESSERSEDPAPAPPLPDASRGEAPKGGGSRKR